MDVGNGSSRHLQAAPGQPAPDLAPGTAEARRPIGEIFVELGFISRPQLETALDVQRRTGGQIGEILVEQGSLTRIDLASALAEHWEPHAYAEEGESLEESLSGAVRSITEQATPQPERDASARPRRGLLRRSGAREDALEDRVEQLAERLAAYGGMERTVSELRGSLADLDRIRQADALATGARMATTEAALTELEGVEARLRAGQERLLDERFEELSLRLDRVESRFDELGRLAEELRVELAGKSARLDDRIQAQVDDAAGLQLGLAAVQETAAGALAAAEERTAELHVEIGSLAGRLDELFGLRHADAQVARVANERLGARLEGLIARQADEAAAALAVAMDSHDDPGLEQGVDRLAGDVASLTRRLEQQGALIAESLRATLEELTFLGKRVNAKAPKNGKQGKKLRRSIDSLAAAIASAEARLAEQRATASGPES